MGMFDSFYLDDPRLACPDGHRIGPDDEWQSKDFDCNLDEYTDEYGRLMRFPRSRSAVSLPALDLVTLDGVIYTDCPRCGREVAYRVVFTLGVLTEVHALTKDAVRDLWDGVPTPLKD